MPIQPTYPGVYIEEIPSQVHTIVGVATSITAFVGRTLRGPVNTAYTINGFGDFERVFGGLWAGSRLGFAVRDFFLNGGSQAIIVRIFELSMAETDRVAAQTAVDAVAAKTDGGSPAAAAQAAQDEANKYGTEPAKSAAQKVATAAKDASTAQGATVDSVKAAAKAAAATAVPNDYSHFTAGDLALRAAAPGAWGRGLRAAMDDNVTQEAADSLGIPRESLFNLTVRDANPGGQTEVFRNVSLLDNPRRVDRILEKQSNLMTWDGTFPSTPPDLTLLKGYRAALKALNDKLAADPNADVTNEKQAVANAQAALSDPVSRAEATLADAKKTLADARRANPPVPSDISAAQTAVNDAQSSLAAALAALGGADGKALTKNSFTPANGEVDKTGLFALEQADLFNLLVLPPYTATDDVDASLVADSGAYCEKRRAFLLVDSPSDWTNKTTARNRFTDTSQDWLGTRSANAALYFPRVFEPNPLNDNRLEVFVSSGVVAGVFARTDAQRGVWKAPAGLEATLVGVNGLSVNLTDSENGELNPLGINCLRSLPAAGRVVWGARTLQGDDRLASQWKYVPIRRLALFIEESLYRGTQWVVFEPNDEPLWAQIRLNVGAFMHNLFTQGAFQGQTPRDAYFVKCDHDTNPQNTVDQGIVNIIVGFAPLKPAEFVIIQLQQIAGQIQV